MTKSIPDPLDWLGLLFKTQKAQLEVTETMIEAGKAMLDPERSSEASAILEEAGKKALSQAEMIARAQWEWLNQWRF